MTETQGWTAPGFEGVRDAFVRNFDEGNEVGAAFSAYHRGQKVVDLWGGIADEHTGRPWEEDSIVLVYSTTKGLTAVCANKLAQEGKLDVDAPVAEYWPEFAAGGQAGRPGVVPALAPGRPARHRRGDESRGRARVGSRRRGARPLRAVVGAGVAARLPRHDVRLVGRRGDPADLGPQRRRVLPRRGRRARSVSTCGSACPKPRSRASRCWSVGAAAATAR